MSEKMTDLQARGFKGVWIPREIWESAKMSLVEKALLIEIHSLDNAAGCFAGNEHLAKFLQVSIPSVTRAIAKLKILGFVEEASFTGRTRTLRITPTATAEFGLMPNQFDEAASSERPGSHAKMMSRSMSSTNEKNIEMAVEAGGLIGQMTEAHLGFPEKWDAWIRYRQDEKRKPLAPALQLRQLKFLAEQADPVAVIETSMRNGWTGLFETKGGHNGNGNNRTGGGQGAREIITREHVARIASAAKSAGDPH